MKIFLSYPSDERALAERVNYALLALGHDVFFDRDDLAAGLAYDEAIVSAIDTSDLLVFLITPASVTAGRYTMTELALAQRRWPRPSGRVLPVMLRATPIESVPAYLRAVSIYAPSGDAVAEIAHETQRLVKALPLTIQATRRLRSRSGAIAMIVAVVALGAAAWLAGGRGRHADADSTRVAVSERALAPVPLPEEVRHRARAVAPAADGGFFVALAAPNEVVHLSAEGKRIGASVPLMGEPVFATPTPAHTMVVTRAPDGVTVLDWVTQHVSDTIRLDPSRLASQRKEYVLANPSMDIQSVAVGGRGMLWITTGERDGAPAVFRFRQEDRRWEVPTWVVGPDGIGGGDLRGLKLRRIGRDLWAITTGTSPSSLYHMDGAIRVDEFEGHAMQMVSCAHDLAESTKENLLFLSCESALQEVSVEAKTLKLESSRPTLRKESAADSVNGELIVSDSASVVIALNTGVEQPRRSRVAQVDGDGAVTTLLDLRDAVVRSMAVTPKAVVVVLRRADGSMDAMRVARR